MLTQPHHSITTLGELKSSGWKSRSVKDEIRENIIRKIEKHHDLFPGIIGYQKSVIPQMVHALLARHDILLLGLRGQAKTRLLRGLVNFLDEYMPEIEGSAIHDDPLNPLSAFAKRTVAELGDDTPIHWVHRSARFAEKLATPDTTVADLIGDIDPIKAATQKRSLSDEEIINFGLIPKSNRGIFVINELPDLQPRIQVALLNIMQERDLQIRGFNIRLPIDLGMYFSANPEDYTNRGNIITPLKDRIDAQIITHYPKSIETGIEITRQEAWQEREGVKIEIPHFMREIIEQVAFEARESEYIDQKSGVSARMTITAMEAVIAGVEHRMILNKEKQTVVRILDLYHMIPSLTGKLELVYEGEQEGAANIARLLLGKAISVVFKKYFPDPQPKKKDGKKEYESIVQWFAQGKSLDISDAMSNVHYKEALEKVESLKEKALSIGKPEAEEQLYVVMEWILEALHQHSMLGKLEMDESFTYTDMLGSMLGNLGGYEFDDE